MKMKWMRDENGEYQLNENRDSNGNNFTTENSKTKSTLIGHLIG